MSACLGLACGGSAETDRPVDGDESEDALSANGAEYSFGCKSPTGTAKLVIAAQGGVFDLKATVGSQVLFQASDQRPSLNVRIEDGESSSVKEYIDFNDKGLETVPADAPKAIEIDLVGEGGAYYSKKLTFKDGAANVALTCRLNNERLQDFLKLKVVSTVDMAGVRAVAFDIDDTLAFTTPTFARGFATGGSPKPDDSLFWTQTNACDLGCPEGTVTLPDGTSKTLAANAASTAKKKAKELIELHKARGHKVYAITARPDINGEPLRDYVHAELGILPTDVFFEPDIDQPGNPKGKTDRIESLDIDVFYGDSDSDITDTTKAFVDGSGARRKEAKAIRFLRSPKSSNRKAGKLNKYHPGYFGELILGGTYE